MRFEFFPLRFEFLAREGIYFAPGQAANILRGAFGAIFRRLACAADCTDARMCDRRRSCPYARVFEPGAAGGAPSGLADWPRPFVFRARHLDGRTIQPGEPFYFDMHIFLLDRNTLDCFVRAFSEIINEGVGPRRGKAELRRVLCLSTKKAEPCALSDSTEPAALDLAESAAAPRGVRVHFLSPTELKHEDGIAPKPEFPILCARLRDRISTLRAFYGAGPLELDFREFGLRAAGVHMTNCEVRTVKGTRRSGRTGQTHDIGGFVGIAEFEGNLGEFLPFLEAGRWVGVGRHAVWGKGEFSLTWR